MLSVVSIIDFGRIDETDFVRVVKLIVSESVVSLLPAADRRVGTFHFVDAFLVICLLSHGLILRVHEDYWHLGQVSDFLEFWWQKGCG